MTKPSIKRLEEDSKHGMLTPLGPAGRNDRGLKLRLYRCDCGTEKAIVEARVRYGDTQSCGCMKRKRPTHGMNRTREHRIWCGIKKRCLTPTCHEFRWYGGRGIRVCDEWAADFAAFYRDVGPCPGPGYSIDRINNDGNYEPGNVRWATAIEQSHNSRAFKNGRSRWTKDQLQGEVDRLTKENAALLRIAKAAQEAHAAADGRRVRGENMPPDEYRAWFALSEKLNALGAALAEVSE
jgi:hypothetical protein